MQGDFSSWFLGILTFLTSLATGFGSSANRGQVVQKIILDQTSTVTITAWSGSAMCRSGQVLLISPDFKEVYTSPDLKITPTPDKRKLWETATPIVGTTLITDYNDAKQKRTIGPYEKGTEIILGFRPGGFCYGTYLSTDSSHAKITRNGSGNTYTIGVEDYKDRDFNDFYVEVAITPLGNQTIDQITAVQAFDSEPIYKLPWPDGVKHKLTQVPGRGEHKGNLAYDFDMRDTVTASEKGIVIWTEDNFGPGSCSIYSLSSVNVVVIQTEEGVNQTYLHLSQDSVKEAKIQVGDSVKQGQIIGRAGNSGYICSDSGNGSHLHIEWQHNCLDVTQAKIRREVPKSSVGKPTLAWSCTNFPPDAPFTFITKGKPIQTVILGEVTSDNVLAK